MFDLISYWFIYCCEQSPISKMFWSQADRQKCQDVDGWFNYSQICIISIVTTDHTPVQYYLSKPEVPKNQNISLCIHYLFRNDLLHLYFSWNLTGKKGGEKGVLFFYNFTYEPGLYMYFVLYALHEHMTKGLYRGQITKSN